MRPIINVIVVGTLKDADALIRKLKDLEDDSSYQEKSHPVLLTEDSKTSSGKSIKRPAAGKPGMYAKDLKSRKKSVEIRQIRKQIGLTQKQLASAIGFTATDISYFETGSRPIPIVYVKRLNRIQEEVKNGYIKDSIPD